jgi:dihydrofolate reductase
MKVLDLVLQSKNSIMKFISVVAMDSNNVIADSEDGIPWNIKEDKEHYLDTIRDEVVIVGRKTAVDATKGDDVSPLTSNTNIIISNQNIEFEEDNLQLANSIEEAVEIAKQQETEKAFVLGGEQIYEQFFPLLDEMIVSHIPIESDGDLTYPKWDENRWEISNTEHFDQFTVKRYKRVFPENNKI